MPPEIKFGPLVYWCFNHPKACHLCLRVRSVYHYTMGINSTFQKPRYLRTWLPSLSRKFIVDGLYYHDGLTASELTALATEGAVITGNSKMDDKWLGFVRHVLNSVGAFAMAYGVMDEATWATIMGAMMTLVPFVWSWVSKQASPMV